METIIKVLIDGSAATVFIAVAVWLFKNPLYNWFSEKIKQDIQHDYAKKLEQFKLEIKESEMVREARWRMKHDACYEALEIINAVWSHRYKSSPDAKPIYQPVSTIKARDCMNKLALACESPEVLQLFMELLCDPSRKITADSIGDFRNAIRRELGFGKDIPVDRNLTYIESLGDDEAK